MDHKNKPRGLITDGSAEITIEFAEWLAAA